MRIASALTHREARAWFKMLFPAVLGLLYAGTGGWSEDRWNTAFLLMGLGPALKMEYERGYWTLNPKLRPDQTGQEAASDQSQP